MSVIEEMPTYTGEITNDCSCTKYDPVTEEYTDEPSDYCHGWCFDQAVEDFANCIEHLWDLSPAHVWRVEGIQLWNRTSGGIVVAHTPLDLIRAMSVDSSWIMRWRVYADRVEYSLSHHDAPMGSASKLTPLPIEDVYVLE